MGTNSSEKFNLFTLCTCHDEVNIFAKSVWANVGTGRCYTSRNISRLRESGSFVGRAECRQTVVLLCSKERFMIPRHTRIQAPWPGSYHVAHSLVPKSNIAMCRQFQGQIVIGGQAF